MKQRRRIYYNAEQRNLMWDRWQKGDSMHANSPSLAIMLNSSEMLAASSLRVYARMLSRF